MGGVGAVIDRYLQVGEGLDGVDAAGAEEDEAGTVAAAVLEEVDGSGKVVVEQVLGAGPAVHSGQDTGIRRAVDDPVHGRKGFDGGAVADVAYADVNAEGAEGLDVGLGASADEAVEADDRQAGLMRQQFACDGAACESANAGDEKAHFLIINV